MNILLRQLNKINTISKSYLFKDENTRKWEGLKGAYAGKRVFMIGNGPSLNKTPLYYLKDEYSLAFNRFYLLHERLNWLPYFYMCVDPEVLLDIYPDINQNLDLYQYAFFHSVYSDAIEKREHVLKMHHVWPVPFFSPKMPLFGSGGTVAYVGLQMLLYLGFSEIYLIGVDQNYVLHTTVKPLKGIRIQSQHDDDPNHFDPRYFGKGRRYHQPVQATKVRMERAFTIAREQGEKRGVKIQNAGIDGMLEVYKRTSFEDLFDYSEEKKLALFAESISPLASPQKVLDILANNDLVLTDSQNIKGDLFTVHTDEEINTLVHKVVTDFIPFGPYKKKYIFIKRTERDRIVGELFV